MSNILVTGALGTIGRPLVKELEKRGNFVYGIDLYHSHHEKYERCDVRNFRKLDEVFYKNNFDYVYHLAAEFGRINGEENYEDLWTTNLVGTRNVAELCIQSYTSMIFASSSEIYGTAKIETLYEDLPKHEPITQLNDYALSKWANEVQLTNLTRTSNLKLSILRFFNVYGAGEFYTPYRNVIALFCYCALHDIPYAVFENHYRTFLYIDDFIPTLANVCRNFHNTKDTVVNIGGTDYRNIKEVSDIVLKTLDKNDSLVHYEKTEFNNSIKKKPEIELAKKYLSHDPKIKIEEGIPLIIDWMKEYYESS